MEHLQQRQVILPIQQVLKLIQEQTQHINKQGSGYTWANGYQMNGAQAKQGYGLTTTWTVPINSSGDTSFLTHTHTSLMVKSYCN